MCVYHSYPQKTANFDRLYGMLLPFFHAMMMDLTVAFIEMPNIMHVGQNSPLRN